MYIAKYIAIIGQHYILVLELYRKLSLLSIYTFYQPNFTSKKKERKKKKKGTRVDIGDILECHNGIPILLMTLL